MSGTARTHPDKAFIDALEERLLPGQDCLGFDAFMECALYHPELGYYTRDRLRVGHRRDTDFYTASSLGQVYSRLVLSALETLVNQPLSEFTFIELGPESAGGILTAFKSLPFRNHCLVRHGDPLPDAYPCILFSNEVFDAQPFRRFVYQSGAWREMGVSVHDKTLEWCLLTDSDIPDELPSSSAEGYLVDWPSGAHSLLESLASGDWEGLFVGFDYGLALDSIMRERPQGTARTYSGHQMGTDLLDKPGHLDLTCHVIWDNLEAILRKNGFAPVELEFQEAFFMHHSQPVLKRIIEDTKPGFSRDKQTLMELIHPGNMGRKFQVLHAKRGIE